jgi:hypothetical protein
MEEDLSTADPLTPNGAAGGSLPNGTADGAPAKKQVRRVGAKPPVDRKVEHAAQNKEMLIAVLLRKV